MLYHIRLSMAAFCLIAFPVMAHAQTATKPRKAPAGNESAVRGESDPLAEGRRATAISLITSLADDARGFHNETLRARVQARAADALWDTDTERARTLFRRAWDAAELSDRESLRRFEEDRRAQMAARGAVVMTSPLNLRGEVLQLAARRDRALGEEFLTKLDEARKQEKENLTTKGDAEASQLEIGSLPQSVSQRLGLARQLLNTGETERAIQFAEPALNRANNSTIMFLAALREKDTAAADQRYTNLLARAAADPASDANTVSLLSSYIFTPNMSITVGRSGGYGISQSGHTTPPADISPQLRTVFFNTAAQILLRPLPPPDQDRTSAGRAGTYFMIARLLPLFEQYAPDKIPALRAQLAALTPDAPESFRSGKDDLLTKGLVPDDPTRDKVQEALDRLNRATTVAERDRIYISAAFAAVEKGDPRARDFVDKIEDYETRRQLRAYLDFDVVKKAVSKKDAQEIVRLARSGELTRIQRVWAYTEATRLLIKSDRARALELLDEAAAEARRIDNTDPDRARALLAVSTQLLEVDRTRVWELIPEVVKAANDAPSFTGEDGKIVIKFQTKETASIQTHDAPSFNLTGIFSTLAKDDMNRAVELAAGFTGEAPRAVATLAIARAVLDEKRGTGDRGRGSVNSN